MATENQLTAANAGADEAKASLADQIPVTVNQEGAIETAETINAAAEAAETVKAEEPKAETPAEPERKVKRLDAWAEKKLSEEAFARREAERARKAAEERLAALEAELAASRRAPPQAHEQATKDAPDLSASQFASKEDFQRAVRAEAERVAREEMTKREREAAARAFNEGCNRIFEEGKKLAPDFEDALKNLGSIGALNEANLEMIIATENGAQLLYDLGADPEEATRVFSLPPAKLAFELGRRIAAKPQKAAAPVSKAPPPVRPVEGTARVSAVPRDDDDEQTYFQKRIAERRKARGLP